MTKFKIGDIVRLGSEEELPIGYIIKKEFDRHENTTNYKIAWFDGWRDTWHNGCFLEKVKTVDQIPDR